MNKKTIIIAAILSILGILLLLLKESIFPAIPTAIPLLLMSIPVVIAFLLIIISIWTRQK